MLRWLLLSAAILLEVSGTLSLRAMTDNVAWVVLFVIGEAGSFVLLALLLRRGAPIGLVYGIWSACGVVLTAVLAAWLFHDPLTWLMGLGIAIVVGGVFLVELGAARHARQADDR
ncbi:SMR family transporter [Microbacterium sp. X-17]|uniref:DMT family transporter n=1 Tax=Microbacterium sp. X-17 TaxID=3144404 RepID=UPI0031F4E78E